MYLHTVIMDKAPEAAAVCISALPLYDSPSVARYGSSCIIAYNDVTKYYIHTYMCIYIYIYIYIYIQCSLNHLTPLGPRLVQIIKKFG